MKPLPSHLLLRAPVAAALAVSFYNRVMPTLDGWPFFYIARNEIAGADRHDGQRHEHIDSNSCKGDAGKGDVFMPAQFAVQLQLPGGWIAQTLPAIVPGLFVVAARTPGLLSGLVAGLASGTWMVAHSGFKRGSLALNLPGVAVPAHAAVISLFINLTVVLAWSMRSAQSSTVGVQSDAQD